MWHWSATVMARGWHTKQLSIETLDRLRRWKHDGEDWDRAINYAIDHLEMLERELDRVHAEVEA